MSPPDEPHGAATNPSSERTDAKLLELLVCPVSRTTLVYDEARQELISRAASLAYPIRHGVPMLTAAAARPLSDAETDALRRR